MAVATRNTAAPANGPIVIPAGGKECLRATGYRRNIYKTFIFHCLSVILLGLPYALVYWHAVFGIQWKYTKCLIQDADMLVLEDDHGQTYVAPVVSEEVGPSFPEQYTLSPICEDGGGSDDGVDEKTLLWGQRHTARYFVHQNVKFLWSGKNGCFEMLNGIERDIKLCDFHHLFPGYNQPSQEVRLQLYGYNTMAVDVKSYWRILVDEVLNPFYLFEIFSVVVWTVDDYIYYAGCVFAVSVISMAVALYEIRQQSQTLSDMAVSHSAVMVSVCRGNEVYESISSIRLVPGDLIAIPPTGCLMSCDAVLVAGTCIVNESVLTGESFPETKTPVPDLDEPYCSDIHKRHTLFCGTQVLQTRYYGQDKVLAVVIRTGFTTAKGELVRSILYPKPIGFKFYMDSLKFVLIMFVVALVGICYCVYVYVTKGATVWEILIRACDMLTIVVPPAMPAAMTVGTVYSQARLRERSIFCISPPRINVCGKLKLMCFDKTGTLTEGGLEFYGIAPRTDDSHFGELVREPGVELEPRDPLLVTLAACHTLTRIQGQLIGDPLELEMFKASHWVLEEPGADITRYDVMAPIVVKPVNRDAFLSDCYAAGYDDGDLEMPYAVGIMRQLPFSSSLQRMSVVVRTLGSASMELLVKGSPEKIASLCTQQSIPHDFSSVLRRYTIRGFRVLALAHRQLDRRLTWHQMHRMKREQMESQLDFLGLLVMRNTLKSETTPVIRQLAEGGIRSVMVTGDHLLTAINVARDCGMLPVGEKVILVTACPEQGDPGSLKIKYSLAEMYEPEPPPEPVHRRPPLAADLSTSSETTPLFTDSWPGSLFSQMETLEQMWLRKTSRRAEHTEYPMEHGRRIHLALCGKTLDAIRQVDSDGSLLDRILCASTVLARMAPDQKTRLVQDLQSLGYVVGMCGDGANDCGALRAAHVGISLSDAEASVAAPFTSRTPNISCVPTIIREGRCALVTSFGVFKYMALYSLIQFISVLILYSLRTTLGDYMFLYHDLVITTTVAVLMGRTEPHPTLVPRRPKGSLLSRSNLFSLTMQIAMTAFVQLAALCFLMLQPWYVPVRPQGDQVVIPCWEVTVIFLVSSFQYLILALAFSYGPPYRRRCYTNVLFMLSLVLLGAFTLTLTLLPIGPLSDFFEVIGIRWGDGAAEESGNAYFFRGCILGFVALHAVVALFIEYLVAAKEAGLSKEPCCGAPHPNSCRNRYKRVQADMELDDCWPLLSPVKADEILQL